MEGEIAEDPTLFPATVGEKLRGAREAQGLELAEVAARTRIPQRHLEAIEKSNYEGLPSVTYALGFAKSYARAVGADEVEIARELRDELGRNPERVQTVPSYEMEDPTRVPPRGLAWAGIAVALLVLVGVVLWYGTGLFRGSAPPPETLIIPEANLTAPDNSVDAAPVTGGHVTLVATDTVWLRVSDANGVKLFEKEMSAGERYDVPADADRPHVRTPRPDRLQVLLNGSQVPPLSDKAELVDVGISAAALQARGQPAPVASATPAPSASPTPAATAPAATPTRAPVRPTPSPSPRATTAPVQRPAPEPATGNTSTAP
ncbi:MAG: helix-turn-helix domain-containing protein [Sphingomonas sp.]|uniref:helix-turn-helix domain-containing protein n=1 Tax=Sphingomonas sp. TaxID=28214 RepID=UPI0025FDD6D5|nr:helix-turn-helix domain-containing protein [Sphingomonas sp.]MBX3565505.1 helix-turn-helix domain-containing protein [Sphingomonas sp.]